MVARTLVAASLLFTLAHEAKAASVLFSPPTNFIDASITCLISNVGKKDVRVRIEIVGDSGAVVTDSGEIVLAPNFKTSALASGNTNPNFCRFTVVKGSKKSVRALANVFDAANIQPKCLPNQQHKNSPSWT